MSFNMDGESKNVWRAMQSVFSQGFSTPDLSAPESDLELISTEKFGDLVLAELKKA